MTATCEKLGCHRPQGGVVLRLRLLGSARHEGTHLFHFCAEHTADYLDQDGYTEVEWDGMKYRAVTP